MTKWQPIATAPKDGTRILLFQPKGDGEDSTRTVAEAAWLDYVPEESGWCMAEGDVWLCPTHWMPLPDAPEAE